MNGSRIGVFKSGSLNSGSDSTLLPTRIESRVRSNSMAPASLFVKSESGSRVLSLRQSAYLTNRRAAG